MPPETQDGVPSTQQSFTGNFPPRDELLEANAAKHVAEAAKEKKAKLKKTAAYDTIKAHMEGEGIEEYYCYTLRKLIVMKPNEPDVKFKDIAETEPSPYRPPVADADLPPAA